MMPAPGTEACWDAKHISDHDCWRHVKTPKLRDVTTLRGLLAFRLVLTDLNAVDGCRVRGRDRDAAVTGGGR